MNGEALYKRIARDLRDQITSGALAPGDRLPSGLSLRDKYNGAARDTVGKALRELQSEGLIAGGLVKTVARHDRIPVAITRQGTGWAGEAPTAGADSWGTAVLAAGREPSQRIEVLIVAASGEPATRLGMDKHEKPGYPLTVRRLIRFVDGEPHNLITFWFPIEFADGTPLAEPESIAEGSIAWLETKLGPLAHSWEAHPRMPAPDEAEILRIPPGVPVEEVWRTSRTPDRVVPVRAGRPVAVSRAIYPGDRIKLTG